MLKWDHAFWGSCISDFSDGAKILIEEKCTSLATLLGLKSINIDTGWYETRDRTSFYLFIDETLATFHFVQL